MDPTCADPLYRRSVRVSMGTVFSVPWTRFTYWPAGLDELRRAGFVVASLTPAADAIALDEWTPGKTRDKVALMVGTEGDGLSEQSLSRSDVALRIPMKNQVDSLNVASAVAVACYALGIADQEGH